MKTTNNQTAVQKASKLTAEQKAAKKAKKAKAKAEKFEKTLFIGRDVSIHRMKSVLNLEKLLYKKLFEFSETAEINDKQEFNPIIIDSYDNANELNLAIDTETLSPLVILANFLSSENHFIYIQQIEKKFFYVCSKYKHKTNKISVKSAKFFDLNDKGDLTKNNTIDYFFDSSITNEDFDNYLVTVSNKDKILRNLFDDDLRNYYKLNEDSIGVSIPSKVKNFIEEIINHKSEIGSYTFKGLSED